LKEVVAYLANSKETLSLALLKNESFCCKTVNNSEAGFRELERRIIRSEEINKKFADHQAISWKTGADIYFARQYRSYERGLNEHTNGLMLQLNLSHCYC
jgi:IS30 family transposase